MGMMLKILINIVLLAFMAGVIIAGVTFGFGTEIPTGDGEVFLFNGFLSGWMVTVDAAIFIVSFFFVLAAWIMHMSPTQQFLHWTVIVLMITAMHAVCGYVGLYVAILGDEFSSSRGLLVWIVLGLSIWAGLRFITMVFDEEEENFDKLAEKMATFLGLIAIFVLQAYFNVSVDEFFAVVQRFQWMAAQGWDYQVMAANIGLSMIFLFLFLFFIISVMSFGVPLKWVEDSGDTAMFVVCSLIMYYMIRAVFQNGLGFTPWEIPYTGLAPVYVVAGFAATWVYEKLLKMQGFKSFMHIILLIFDDDDDEVENALVR